MKRFWLILILTVLQFSCNRRRVVYIQPLGNVPYSAISIVKAAIENFYHYTCIVKPAAGLAPDILAASKTRYDADKILSKYNNGDETLVLTAQDIATANPQRRVKEWGIFGLGDQPGNVCVVSVYRLRNNVSGEVFKSRLVKVCLHEIGHNFGLPHCQSGDSRCMMQDAQGTIKEVDHEEVYLCQQCRKKLIDGGVFTY